MNSKNKLSNNKHCHIVLFNNNHVSLGTGNCNLVTAEVWEYALAAGRKGFIGISPVLFDLSLHKWNASVYYYYAFKKSRSVVRVKYKLTMVRANHPPTRSLVMTSKQWPQASKMRQLLAQRKIWNSSSLNKIYTQKGKWLLKASTKENMPSSKFLFI